MNSIEIAGEVVTASTALAGFILVYLGGLHGSYSHLHADQRSQVKAGFQRRAWFAFVGITASLTAAVLGIAGEWLDSKIVADMSVAALAGAFVVGFAIAYQTVRAVV
jgi:hypothetical protein